MSDDAKLQLRDTLRNILYRNMPADIDGNVCRDIAEKILEALPRTAVGDKLWAIEQFARTAGQNFIADEIKAVRESASGEAL